ncbi:YihY/virulence factor BrkB family protein [Mangrovimonas sp. AS39]|uniref:YihY/virulence factor BrkB family protein n=1 Tax=Mangrovimonas TaxID=1211036 RepID=UPI0006B61578|nr:MULTISPECIES: YihY/virulence factor BrkB family protein [Mangrovimonas]MCF1191158.1 YihY/virulence factor BrkB family protein [Mangrovimonas futianensis]MCF1194853.1 YihY/virulence factor BrkB family protein [Mangrovimonas futianensis]MCF1421472.1 YihY/virulence factor BrkB family protein [Mangrovimonas futianensis]NIK92610.1 YihY/virulence factor BrkB family protein [Mangrovimonas sp. CR14]
MTKQVEDKLEKIPIVNLLVKLLKGLKLPGLEGLSVYDLLELYGIGIVKGALTTRASAIAFSFFTALFPFLLFVLIVIPYIPIDDFKIEFLKFLNSFLPSSTSDFFFDNIFVNIDNTANGGLISSVLFASIFLMANGINAVFSGFESSYHEQLTRNPFKQYVFALGVALILAFLLILNVVVLGYIQIYISQNLEQYGLVDKQNVPQWLNLAKYAFFVLTAFLATATLYYFGTKEGRHSKFFSIGALFTTLLIILNSYLFGLYIENFGRYNELYGSIGALLILMFYLWLNSTILLLGYELNATLNRLKKQNRKNA